MGIDNQVIAGIDSCFHGKTYGPRMKIKRYPSANMQQNWIIEGYRGFDCYFWPEVYLRRWREAQRRGGLLCFDEIQSGFGRTGKAFAYEHYDITPDLLVIGKGAFSGFPGSAVLSRSGLISAIAEGELSSTHGGGPLACAAGLETLKVMVDWDLVYESYRKGLVLHGYLNEIPGMVGKTAGRGLVAAVFAGDSGAADDIVLRCRDRGLLLVHTGKSSVKIGPPLTITDKALVEGLDILKGVLRDVTP